MNYEILINEESSATDDCTMIGAVPSEMVGGGTGVVVGGLGLAVVGLGGLAATIALLVKAKYGWAALTFFVFSPLAFLVVGGITMAAMAKR